ncbi:hypothetical protein AVEN_114335-1 [Araneus ventricosus]|uniref:Uncharacterized protein n=1 Tax=Araneus ventricosus TaxID=182803 RepID=A0A4Y2HP65_ARAVE|nr:hypothetical protein AVEN_114335-1 [Araneus ventricosus]
MGAMINPKNDEESSGDTSVSGCWRYFQYHSSLQSPSARMHRKPIFAQEEKRYKIIPVTQKSPAEERKCRAACTRDGWIIDLELDSFFSGTNHQENKRTKIA